MAGFIGVPWVISAEERARHDQQFTTLNPSGGLITGDQARGFLMRSGLPPGILAQIWDMSDLNRDGKMDKKEFSIAMFLIQKRLQGVQLPAVLPESLKAEPMRSGRASAPIMAPAMSGSFVPLMPTGPPNFSSVAALPMAPASLHPTVDVSQFQASRLKYSQMFNNLDRTRVGSLSGVHARNILSQTGLGNQILAQIWTLSDLDKDGRLTCEEFCLAMYLVDVVLGGGSLPSSISPDLMSAASSRQRTTSVTSIGSKESESGDADESAKAAKIFKSFEDRRKDNFDRGQAELERRRQILLDQERKEREERMRKENEEAERRERERLEQERRRQLEADKHMARQRELELQRQEDQRKMLEQREAARREMERQRRLELERQRLQELTIQRQREQEMLCHVKQKQKNLSFQLQALNEKSGEMNQKITEMRERIVAVTGQIENMKRERDLKLGSLEMLKQEVQEKQILLSGVGMEKQNVLGKQRQLTGSTDPVIQSLKQVEQGFHNKQINMEKMRSALEQVEKELQQKRSVSEERRQHLERLQTEGKALAAILAALYERLAAKQAEARAMLDSRRRASGSGGDGWAAFPEPGPEAHFESGFVTTRNLPVDSAAANSTGRPPSTSRYRAKFEFQARVEDELSFQPGDIILVFKDHVGESGWLAGQIRDKVGWFPEDFAECLDKEESGQPVDADSGACSENEAFHKLGKIEEEGCKEEPKMASAPPEDTAPVPAPASSQDDEAVLIAQALYPWKAKKDTHLTFQKGDKIKILERQEMWWRGELKGKSGWFPKSVVRLVDGSRRRSSGSRSQTPASESEESRAKSPPEVGKQGDGGDWVTAIYPFAAPEEGDLGFEAGERILVIKREEEWWTGKIGDRVGIFPSLYAQPTEDASQPPPPPPPPPPPQEQEVVSVAKVIAPFTSSAPNQLSLAPGDLIRVHTKSPTGWWEGEVQKKGQEKRSGWFPGNYVQMLGEDGGGGTSETVVAQFDYTAQQEDELSFSQGAHIVVLERLDADWWKGRLENGSVGLLPANYVQPLAIGCPTWQKQERKFSMHKKELLETEQHFIKDLDMVMDVFGRRLKETGVLSAREMAILFGNWEQLLENAKALLSDLRRRPESPGTVVLDHARQLGDFVAFCKNQQEALHFLEEKERLCPSFRAVYSGCCQEPRARGLPLTYFLLLPLTRVTKYPLVLDKLLEYSPPDLPDRKNLEKALGMSKNLCSEVNQVVTEVENLHMLYWCQNHIRCDSLQTPLVFHSQTNRLGGRKFLHSGILYKAKSNRLLVALLFNDFLMLTTPEQQMDDPESFKLTRTSDVLSTLYRTPILLHVAKLLPADDNDDGRGLSLTVEEQTLTFRAVSSNARILWTRQLDKAIQAARRAHQQTETPARAPGKGIGRLLIELVCVRHLNVTERVVCQMGAGGDLQTKELDLAKKESLCTTQFLLGTEDAIFHLALFLHRLYAPDLCAGRVEFPLEDLIQSSGSHRGPILKQFRLSDSEVTDSTNPEKPSVIIKFVVQMFAE